VGYYHLVAHRQQLYLLGTCIVYCFNLSPRRTSALRCFCFVCQLTVRQTGLRCR
jgi:hypothetical protein